MRDPFLWSIPMGRLFGIAIKVHILFPLLALAAILRVAYTPFAPEGAWVDMTCIVGLTFLSVLLHEFGHCFGARWVHGDAHEILMWPLGGLASVEVPHTPRANFITTACGPLVNLVLCAASAVWLAFVVSPSVMPHWNPFDATGGFPFRFHDGSVYGLAVHGWDGSLKRVDSILAIGLSWLFYINWILFWFNVLIVGFPLDGGRLLQAVLWKYVGYRQATMTAVFAGFGCMFILGLIALVGNELLLLCLAIFIYVSCKMQWMILESGLEDSPFGYDFSQGYTSLERDDAPTKAPPRKKLGWWARWRQRRAQQRIQRENENRIAEESRMDELLQKVQDHGMGSLTDEEKRFMKRVSDRYRNNRS